MTLNELVFGTAQLQANIINVCTRFDIDMSTSEQTEISIEVIDPTFALLATTLFRREAPFSWRDIKCEVTVVETGMNGGSPSVNISGRSKFVQAFKKNKKAIVRSNLSPTQFLTIEAQAIGATVVAQSSPKRSQIARVNTEDKQESTWDVMQRMANEEGFLFYEASGVFYFGKPSWLIQRPMNWEMFWNDPHESNSRIVILEAPDCRLSEDADEASTISLVVDRSVGTKVRPGERVNFQGVPGFAGKYMVDSVNWDELSFSEPVGIELTTPIDPEPAGVPDMNTNSSNTSATTKTATSTSQPTVGTAQLTGGGIVLIGQGGHRLRADAAEGFKRWQNVYGRTIWLTDSYRSYEQQAAAYASDPRRFAPPGTGYHVKGLAVDVWLQKLGIAGYKGEPGLIKLNNAAIATGWFPLGDNGKGVYEPWHFSYGSRG